MIHPRLMGVVVAQVQVIAATPVHIAALAASRPTPPVGALVDPRSPALGDADYTVSNCRHVHSPGFVGLYKPHFPAHWPNCQRLHHQRHGRKPQCQVQPCLPASQHGCQWGYLQLRAPSGQTTSPMKSAEVSTCAGNIL